MILNFLIRLATAGEEVDNLDESNGLDINVKKDINGLKLSHIHGYRGFDCRDNLFYINETCIVYPAAAAGVVYDMAKSNNQKTICHNLIFLSR